MFAKSLSARRRLIASAVAVAFTAGVFAASTPAASGDSARHGRGGSHTVDLQLLAINDFHGNLEPPQGSSGQVTELDPATGTTKPIDAGGVEYLATSLRNARKGNKNSITVAAGDIVGASPLLSGLFHDEPTIEAMNKIGLDVAGVGNHEFDEGSAELLRLEKGGCHPVDGCYAKGRKFKGADYPLLAANVLSEKTKKPILQPYWIERRQGVKVGFIGVTLEGTPNIVTAEGVKGLQFRDEVETINTYTRALKKQGVKAIVALVHEGGMPASSAYNYDCDGTPNGISGPIVDIAKGIDSEVDAVITGHTHQAYVCTIPDPSGRPRLVTSASSFGKLYTDLDMRYDRRSGDIVRTSVKAANHVVVRTQPKAADLTQLLTDWKKLADPVANRPFGYITADINGRGSTALEKPLGSVIADAQLEGLAPADKGGAQLAFMNPGGIRADLVYAASGAEGNGVVTYGEAFAVQPFTNMMNVFDFTGAQILTALQQQVSGANEASPRILQVSKGFTYTLDLTKTGADRIVADSVRLNGAPLDPAATYRVAINEFLGGGGDGFPVLREGANKLVGPSDLDLFTAYLAAHSSAAAPLAPPAQDRITIIR
ncbi:bifunctional metallophosphatase/5'-nucleotidase [Actinomadura sp. HBU206391]|uniref:bifunctional metallophosphatase/5'-nucleotidase n=1 Tax=Actinomadura sp. HBU206391 TaxID=2731692 RepID=UPI00164F1826|nr:bifunctional metallophosphatase/5'-nucleotidase [Actinomadura sp. HBU206391]MBC6461538.1 5'-nucleotidase C-terminal domain-containing protein [Actinomadura sp. HBU206391]